MSNNLSDRLYDLSDNLGGGHMADEIESCARQASEVEVSVNDMFGYIDLVNRTCEGSISGEMYVEFMKWMAIYKARLGRCVVIEEC